MGRQHRIHTRSRIARIARVALAVACLSCQLARAQDLTAVGLDQLLDLELTGASKFSLRLSESPSAATVIGAEEIRALGYRTLADALKSVRGVNVSTDRNYAYLDPRGYSAAGDYNTRVLLLIDGHRVNDNIYEQAYLGTEFPLDMDLVERIEFIPGQGSAVHGANALFAVINVVTRSAASAAGEELSIGAGGGSLRTLRASTSRRLGDTGRLMLSAGKRWYGGTRAYYAEHDTPAENHGISPRTDHEHGQQLYLKFEQGGLATSLIHSDRLKGVSAMAGTVFGDRGSSFRDTITLIDTTLRRRVSDDSEVKLHLYGGDYQFRGDYILEPAAMPTLNRDVAHGNWWGVETNFFTQRFHDHKLVAGTDFQFSTRLQQSNDDLTPVAAHYLDDLRTARRYSAFIEDQWTLTPAWSITGGLRYDHIEAAETSNRLSPRLALVGKPAPRWVVKAIHGRAFRPANAYERYYNMGGSGGSVGYKGNPDLRDEQVRGTEGVIEYRPSTSTRWTASVYANRADELLVQSVDPNDGLLTFWNGGSMRMRGAELEVERVWPAGVQLRASYSAQRVRDESNLNLADRIATRLGKVSLIVPVGQDWTVGLQSLLVGKRGDVAGHGVTNLTLSKAWNHERASVSFGVQDLFDRRPVDPRSMTVLQPVSPQDGRTWRLQLRLAF